MKKRTAASMAAIVGLAAVVLVALSGPAWAHEERKVGAYHFVVGWGEEPAYAGIKNSVQLILSTASGKAVNNLGDTLQVEVIFGNQKLSLPLELNFDPDSGEGMPGDYRAWMIPTSPGDYTFHFSGKIGTQSVDQSFTSGPSTFEPVKDPAQVEFPIKEPPVSQVAGLAQRLSARLQAAMAAQRRSQDSANSAKTIGYIGIAVGSVGILVGALALAMSRRRAVAPIAPQTTVSAERRS
jgi:hypothetical protein